MNVSGMEGVLVESCFLIVPLQNAWSFLNKIKQENKAVIVSDKLFKKFYIFLNKFF
jgi:hypothetical protein